MANNALDEGSEEGEIVDSDEENNMLLRIKELEAKNDELEKIATISGVYIHQYDYGANFTTHKSKSSHTTSKNGYHQYDVGRLPSDASTISSDEYEPVKKRHRRKEKHTRSQFHNKCRQKTSRHSRRSYNHENNFKVKNSDDIYKKNSRKVQRSSSPILVNDSYLETISIDSDESCGQNKKDISFRNDYDNDCSLHVNRDTLRFALARDNFNEHKSTGNFLKERLCNGNVLVQKENKNAVDIDVLHVELPKDVEAVENNAQILEEDESATQEEQELRLIALKSAVLKKHLARKKRNAEMAYSPTDFEPVIANASATDDNMDVVEDELNDLDDVMEISPINSPKLCLSLENDEEISQHDFRSAVDDKSVRDMDIVDTASEEELYNSGNNTQVDQWCPIDVAPMTTSVAPVNETLKYPLPVHYAIYVPEMQYQMPPPAKMSSFQDEQTEDGKQFQPLLPTNFNFCTSLTAQHDMFQHLETLNKEIPNPTSLAPNRVETDSNSCNSPLLVAHDGNDKDNDDKDSDEEASALRAVLLSKLQTAKNQKSSGVANVSCDEDQPNAENACQTDTKLNKTGVESVLQKALRRLKSGFVSSASNSKENDAQSVTEERTESAIEEPQPSKSEINDDHTPEIRLTKKNSLTRNRIIKKIMHKALKAKVSALVDKDGQAPPTSDLSEVTTSQASCDNEKIDVIPSKVSSESPSSVKNNAIEEQVVEEKEYIEIKNDAIHIRSPELVPTPKPEITEQRKACESVKKNSITNENGKIKVTMADLKEKLVPTAPTVHAKVQPLSAKNNLVSTAAVKPSEHLSPILSRVRTTKIVRRNKIINKELTTSMKRTATNAEISSTQLPKIQRTIINTNALNSISQQRTAGDTALPRIVVRKLIINLGDSDSVTSDEEFLSEVRVPLNNSISRLKTNTDTYNDIASPLELLMSSASCSPAPSKATPKAKKTHAEESTASEDLRTVNPAFEQRLDSFLKGIREKESQASATKTSKHSPIKCLKPEPAKNLNTPLAVRHLPLASQEEYRRLVYRMKLLEKQKHTKKSDEEGLAKSTTPLSKIIPNVAKKSVTTNTPNDMSKRIVTEETQLKMLHSYENSFIQTSDNIMRILNKSLSVVAAAKTAKIAKLRDEKRLKDLRIEMERLQAQIEQEDRKFSNMKPHLVASNQFLTTLKKKRRSVQENATKLGKTLKGENYRINNKTGAEIIAMSRKLQAEIKFVNCLKIENIELVLAQLNSIKSSDEQHNKKSRTKSVGTEVVVGMPVENAKDDDEKAISSTQSQSPTPQPQDESRSNIGLERDNSEEKEVTATNLRGELEVHQEHALSMEVNENSLDKSKQRIVPDYISPLDHLKNIYGNVDYNAIVCPFEMWGKCADKCCQYMHITVGREQESELLIKPLKYGSDSMV